MAKKSTSKKKKVAKKAAKKAARKSQPKWTPPARDFHLDLPPEIYYGYFSL